MNLMEKGQLTILLLGRNEGDLTIQKELLSDLNAYQITIRLIPSSAQSPFDGIDILPDVAVLNLDRNAEHDLKTLALNRDQAFPSIILVGHENHPKYLRLALQIGARDFLSPPNIDQQLVDCLVRMHHEKTAVHSQKGRICAIINANGGSGATFLTHNLAHIVAVTESLSVAAVDLNLQFGTLGLHMDLVPKQALSEVINNIDKLDSSALDGYMSKHKSGVRLLASSNDRVLLSSDISSDNLDRLIRLVGKSYDRVFVDLPQQIDSLTGTILENADQILIVLQQSLAGIRNATILKRIMTNELDILEQKVCFVVNRFNRKSVVSENDISEALNQETIHCIPNDYNRVAQASDLGLPLYEYAKRARVTKSLIELLNTFQMGTNATVKKRKGALRWLFPSSV